MKNDLTVSGVYIASVIGAGFASGSEIVCYFAVYGKYGFLGIIIASLLFALSATAVLEISQKTDSRNWKEVINVLFGKKCAAAVNMLTVVFMFCIFAAMLAGSGESLSEIAGCKKAVGVFLILIITAVILVFDVRGFMAANGVMAVFIVAGTLGVCLYLFNFREINVFKSDMKWLASGAAYTGYNVLTAGAVLPPMSEFCKSSRRVGIISGGIIFVLLCSLWGIISIYYAKIDLGVFPMLTLCRRHGVILGVIYSAVLFAAMLTTAVANAFSLTDICSGKKVYRIGFVIALGLLLSSFKFDFFIGKIYKYAGYMGIAFMIYIVWRNRFMTEKKIN